MNNFFTHVHVRLCHVHVPGMCHMPMSYVRYQASESRPYGSAAYTVRSGWPYASVSPP